jgi:hypothetical protein
MPSPKKYKSKPKYMKSCMHQVKTVEGKPQKQAVAQCLNVWKNKSESVTFVEYYFENKE